jgi:hypothetical protein
MHESAFMKNWKKNQFVHDYKRYIENPECYEKFEAVPVGYMRYGEPDCL